MAQEYTQVNFRIPTNLKEKIEVSALENNRSITSELVSRLEQSFNSTNNNEVHDLKKEMERMNETIKILSSTLSSLVERGNK